MGYLGAKFKQKATFCLFCVFALELFFRQQKTFESETRVYFFFYDYLVDMYVSFMLQI